MIEKTIDLKKKTYQSFKTPQIMYKKQKHKDHFNHIF